jgi:hypothetical protein
MSPRRIALWLLIGSVGASALLGIIIVLAGNFSEIEVRIMVTTLTISAMSICALAAGALWESGRKKPLSLAGIILAIVAAAIILVGIWTRTSSEEFWKFSASVGLVAVATAHACLISLASLSKSFAWARIAAFIAVYALASEFIYIFYGDPEPADTIVRIIGATSIVVAALTIVTPIFHRLSRTDIVTDPLFTQRRILISQIACPQCSTQLPNAAGEIECETCGCRFTITILDPGSPKAAPSTN